MATTLKTVLIFLIILFSFLFFEGSDCKHYRVYGDSNGEFFQTNEKDRILVCKYDPLSFQVGEFPVRRDGGRLLVHPVKRIVERDGQIIGYVTKGIKNDSIDSILFPNQIIGRAYRIFEDGSVEEDTRYSVE